MSLEKDKMFRHEIAAGAFLKVPVPGLPVPALLIPPPGWSCRESVSGPGQKRVLIQIVDEEI